MNKWLMIGVVFVLIGCEKNNRHTTLPFAENTIFLGHKGSGTNGEYGNTFYDNSIEGIVHALEVLDGTEFDLQMSADSTLWVFHDNEIKTCLGEMVNFGSLQDADIAQHNQCNYQGSFSTIIGTYP